LINDGVTSREHYSIYIHDENKFTKNKKKTSCRKGVYLLSCTFDFRDSRSRDRMVVGFTTTVVGFTTTYAISGCHH